MSKYSELSESEKQAIIDQKADDLKDTLDGHALVNYTGDVKRIFRDIDKAKRLFNEIIEVMEA